MDSFIGEIRIFGGDYAPMGWMFCAGQEMPINQQFYPLFQAIGDKYGGNPGKTFKLPDLRGKVALGVGQETSGSTNYGLAQTGGGKYKLSTVPPHSHDLIAINGTSNSANAKGNLFGVMTRGLLKYGQAFTKPISLNEAAIEPDLHTVTEVDNMQPSLAVNFIIYVIQV